MFALIDMKHTIHFLAFQACQALTKGLASHSHKGPNTLRGYSELMEEKGWKMEQKIMEKKEFHKGEFPGFRCVLECFETRCVLSLWLDLLFIVARVDLSLRTCTKHVLLTQRGCLYSRLARLFSLSANVCFRTKHVLCAKCILGWAFLFHIFAIFYIFFGF